MPAQLTRTRSGAFSRNSIPPHNHQTTTVPHTLPPHPQQYHSVLSAHLGVTHLNDDDLGGTPFKRRKPDGMSGQPGGATHLASW